MRRTRAWVTLLGVALGGLLSAAPAAAAPASVSAPALTLTATSKQARYTTAQGIAVTLHITNSGTSPCAITTMADDAMLILSGTRDGAALTPDFASADTVEGCQPLSCE